ncbi:MAG TPA: ABC transporter ATP-binding protein [Oscillatoriales cyanobacterium M59_W2019_021]|nr:ABC transporter ATP-binding protein [Oscillatoriales cyanobacterium M4454_W2019_049]HIK50088.1 ABC transporter ATP-binding protein [Oscillatoriales cyanobacterium M59_W2019_021]
MSPNRLLFNFAARYPILIAQTLAFDLSGALFNGIGTTLIVPLLLIFLGQPMELPGAPPLLRSIFSNFDIVDSDSKILLITAAVLLAIVLKNAAVYGSAIVSSSLARKLVLSIRKEAIDILLSVDLDYYAKHRVGDILNRVNAEVVRTASAIRSGISSISIILTIGVFVILLLSISWELTILSTLVLGLVAYVNQYFVRRSKQYGKLLSQNSSLSSVALQELLHGIRLIKATGNEAEEYDRLKCLMEQREAAEFQSLASYAIIAPVNEVTGILTFLAIAFLGSQFLGDRIEALSPILLTYLIVLFRLLPYIGKLSGERSKLANTSASVAVLADFLRRDDKPFMQMGKRPFTGLQQGIRLEGVSFRYPNHDEFVLKELDLWIPRGTTMALVGSSGAGKSTLVDLLPRFYDPTSGKVTIDDCDLREYDLKSLRRSMGIVSQDTYLFNNTLRYNIAYAHPEATEADIIAAIKKANAYEFIEQLPQQLDTQVGDRGILLSGGQKQRIAIARAILSNPDILILDEATSALDTVSEKLVQRALEELSRDRTTIVIAHRLSTIQKADCIAVLHQGKIVETGTHSELLDRNGYYANLYRIQFSQESQSELEIDRDNIPLDIIREIRTRLNPTIGYLGLLADEIVDSPEERQELTQEAYDAAVRILKTVQFLEEKARMGNG